MSTKLWVWLSLAFALLSVAFVRQANADSIAILVLCIGALLVAMWKLTRALAQVSTEERGSIGGWIGWGLVSVWPTITWMFATDPEMGGYLLDPNWQTNSLVTSALEAIMVLFVLMSAARAINAGGPPLKTIWRYWKPGFWSLALGYFILTTPFYLLSDWSAELADKARYGSLAAFAFEAFSQFIILPSLVLSIAYTVLAYREVPKSEC